MTECPNLGIENDVYAVPSIFLYCTTSERLVNQNPKLEGSRFYSTDATLVCIGVRIAIHEAIKIRTLLTFYMIISHQFFTNKFCLGIANAIVEKTDKNAGVYSAITFVKNVLPPFHIDYLDCSEDTVYGRKTEYILNCVAFQLKKLIEGKKLQAWDLLDKNLIFLSLKI